MNRKPPKYGVFIIESMRSDDELNGKLDGKILKEILELCSIPNEYHYIKTKLELSDVIKRFSETDFGFLHLSCHGDAECFALTCEDVKFEELGIIIGEHMKYRRLFLSVCKTARFELAKYFIPKHHCYSIVGTPNSIAIDKAAIFWSSFYYLMYSKDKVSMKQVDILPTLLNLTNIFQMKLNYYSIIRDGHGKSNNHLREIYIENGKASSTLKETEFYNKHRELPTIASATSA